jgi:ABC-type branched-subunit amino acid transport system ATPase component/ABC-type branched-subunit amino acid transport system permease subunit
MTDAARDLYLFVAVLGLLPAVGLAGFPALAQSAFVAVGAVGALKLEAAGLPIGGAALLATGLGALAGALTGLLVARATPPFLALSTWAIAWLAYVTLLGFPSLSGGGEGLTRPAFDRVETPFGLAFDLTPEVHVAAAAILCVAALAVVLRLRAGALGSDALAIHDDAELARALRVPIARRAAQLFALSGAAAAAAGAGVAVLLGVAAPADMAPLLALQLLAAAVAAGRHPLLGLVVIVALQRAPDLVTPFVLVAAVALRPNPRPYVDDLPAPEPPPLEPTDRPLIARDLRRTLGGREILRGLDLEVAPGEIHALVGANGSGKTTALNALRIPHTFQRAADLDSLTPYRQILLALRATHHDPRVWTYLELVGLEPYADELTAGERRLLAVARVAATGAPALAFDEPTVGLTAAERARLRDALRALAGAGRAILVVEHDLRFVDALADHITVIDEGRAVGGDPREAIRKVYAT